MLDKDWTGAAQSGVAATSPKGHRALARSLVRDMPQEAKACQSLVIWLGKKRANISACSLITF